jgi:membrane protein YqaA with SNARE-associated domain
MSEAVTRSGGGPIRRLYDWTLAIAGHRHAAWGLGAVSFAESSIFPIPPDVLLVPMCIAQPKKAWFYAIVCTIASVLGGIVGYAIGLFLYDTLGLWIIELYGLGDRAKAFEAEFAEWGLWVILIKGLTPIPYKLVTILCGFAHFNFMVFVLASIVTRGARFFIVAGLVYLYGEPIKEFVERRLNTVALGVLLVIILGFVIVRYVI